MLKKFHPFLFGLGFLLLTLLLDQLSKWAMLDMLALPGRQPITLAPFFDLVMVWNYGISFGLFAAQNQRVILLMVSGGILFILLRWLWRTRSYLAAAGLGSVMGGALGNVADRLRYGAVADFLDIHWGIHHWPAFNIADSAIFIGVVILCFNSMFMERKQTINHPEEPPR